MKQFFFSRAQYKHNQRGFTLVELLLFVVLFAFLLLTLTEILLTIMEIRSYTQALSSVQQDSRYILTRLMNDVHRASTVTTPSAVGSSSATLQLTIDGSEHTYSVADGNLVLTTATTSAQLNGSETMMSNQSFQKIGNASGKETVRVQLTIQSKTVLPIGRETRQIQTTLGRR